MTGYWFRSLASGEKVTASSVQAISRLAQREADKFGQAVQIMTGAEGRKSHRKMSMARNPDPSIYVDHELRMMGHRRDMAAHKAADAAQKYVIHAVSRRDTYKLTRKSLAAANKLAAEFEDAGYQVTVSKANPATRTPTKASKARKTASNKRGAYVEYLEGGIKKRIKYGNKGIATIRAKAMKADGWRGVRVISA